MNQQYQRLRRDCGEVSSWLILAAGLVIAAVLASSVIGGLIGSLAGNVGNQATQSGNTDQANTTNLFGDVVLDDGTVVRADGAVVLANGAVVQPDGTVTLPDGTVQLPDDTILLPDGRVVHPDGTIANPDGSVRYPDGTFQYPDGSVLHADGTFVSNDGVTIAPDGTVTLADGTIRKPNGTVILPDGTYYVPQQEIPPHLEAVYDAFTSIIDDGNDRDISNLWLEVLIDVMGALPDEDREALLAAFSEEQLGRFFHNVDSSSLLSDDLSDKARTNFYTLLKNLSPDMQKRLGPHTDYFERYDSALSPITVPISEPAFVEQYESIVNLPIEDFLALRAHMWENPDLIADSPFDWYADGCSIPGGQYPGPLNGPCLRHDFAYTNARQAAERFDEASYQDVGADGIADQWKNRADDLLHDDIAALPFHKLPAAEDWAEIVYAGVAFDTLGGAGLGSGKEAFETVYDRDDRFYGPGYDAGLGRDDDFEQHDAYADLVGIATATN